MAKLPPPYIEGKIPAQSGEVLNVPFRLNRATNISSVKKIYARIKTIATNTWLGTLETTLFSQGDDLNYIATFNLKNEQEDLLSPPLNPGQYYKIQLAFADDDLGYYSSIGVFKYTTQPNIYIQGLGNESIGNLYTYTGVYEQINRDSTEKVYSYQFDVKHGSEIIATSGLLLHDSSADESNASDWSSDTWVLNEQLLPGATYTIQYTVNTINGLTCTSPTYKIVNNELDDEEMMPKYEITAQSNFENGYIEVFLKSNQINSDNTKRGGLLISRSSSKDNFKTWEKVMTFTLLNDATLPAHVFTDFTVEQGVEYLYSLQCFNDSGFYSARIITAQSVLADFEDIFLYDGKRQLKIRFNPKVSSFKNTILESKVNTIGSRYPFVFRNGTVKYKEFPIAGLISYLSDNDELFMSDAELGFYEERAVRTSTPHDRELRSRARGTQIDTANILAERKFKLSVLEWLTNGQPKLFRSPGEGNYIVSIFGASLTPNDTVSRMLHSFQATASEIADCTFENLIKYKFIEDIIINNKALKIETIDLFGKTNDNYLMDYSNGVQVAEFHGVPTGTIFNLQFADSPDSVSIAIPPNGFYKVNIYDKPLKSITMQSLPQYLSQLTGYIDIGYYENETTGVGDFSEVRKIILSDKAYQQIGSTEDMIADLEDTKYKTGYFHYLKAETREHKEVYLYNGKYYRDENHKNLVNINSNYLYHIMKVSGNSWFDGNDSAQTRFAFPTYEIKIRMNNSENIETIMLGNHQSAGSYVLPSANKINSLEVGSGIIIDCVYQQKEYVYCVEEDDENIKALKQEWINNQADSSYDNFIKALDTALNK